MPSDPVRCCILGVCCPPGGVAQAEAMTTYLHEAFGGSVDREKCGEVAAKILAEFKLTIK